MRFRRRIEVCGLEDATVYFFPEAYCNGGVGMCDVACTPDRTPILDPRIERVEHPEFGVCFRAEHISGDVAFLVPRVMLD
jgi:hypothetical protein